MVLNHTGVSDFESNDYAHLIPSRYGFPTDTESESDNSPLVRFRKFNLT